MPSVQALGGGVLALDAVYRKIATEARADWQAAIPRYARG